MILFGNHDNHSIIKCLFANYGTNVTPKHPFSDTSRGYNFRFKSATLGELIVPSFFIFKMKSDGPGCARIKGGTSGK